MWVNNMHTLGSTWTSLQTFFRIKTLQVGQYQNISEHIKKKYL